MHEQQNRGLNRRTEDIEEIERNKTFRDRSFDAAKLAPSISVRTRAQLSAFHPHPA